MSVSTDQYVVVLGAALSANKGAAAMLQALVDNIDDVAPGARVVSLSTYPEEDRKANRNERLDIVSLTARQMLFPVLPLAIFIWLARMLRLPVRPLALTGALRALLGATVVADLAGISFSGGRGLPTLVYNTLMTGLPLLVGAPVVKCSQALGPFDDLLTRLAARMVLPRLRMVVARGDETHRHLEDLGLERTATGADLSFIMKVDSDHRAAAAALIPTEDHDDIFLVSPSSVVRALCEKEGIDYLEELRAAVDAVVQKTGLQPVIVPHSARLGRPESRMNDLPVCTDLHEAMTARSGALLIGESLEPAVLRALIGMGRILLTSRFHAMISGLATGTPTVVAGWSHKYAEVMSEFGLEQYVIPFYSMDTSGLVAGVTQALAREAELRELITSELPRVEESSRVSLQALRSVVDG